MHWRAVEITKFHEFSKIGKSVNLLMIFSDLLQKTSILLEIVVTHLVLIITTPRNVNINCASWALVGAICSCSMPVPGKWPLN